MMNSLNGKKILLTGGSRGIGAGIVRFLANQGCQLAFTYSSNEASARQVLESLPHGPHFVLQMDISNEASISEGFEKALTHLGGLDGLVNNAGITRDQLLLRMKAEDFDAVMQTNLRGGFLLTKAAVKSMLKAKKGSIVNITSVIGQTGNAGQANYAASKAGLEAFSKSVALEIASRGIRVNCVAPGYIDTEMTQGLTDSVKNEILTKIPLQHIGTSDDVAAAVAFLLSDEAKYITGQTIAVNGGMRM